MMASDRALRVVEDLLHLEITNERSPPDDGKTALFVHLSIAVARSTLGGGSKHNPRSFVKG
jgi:hypothetical protein